MHAFPTLMTAMATPFTADGAVDLDGAQALATHLVAQGSRGIVVAGTTGESPTLAKPEAIELFRAVSEAVGDSGTVIAGTGTYDTAATAALVEEVSATGVDAVMVLAPYYNRPTQRGLEVHFRAAAGATDLPVLIYNIPPRTAVEISPQTLLRLAEDVPNVRGVKDAVGDMAKASWLAARAPKTFGIYSGDDKNCLPLLAVGGVGLVSVAAHLVARDLATMIDVFEADPVAARRIHLRLLPIMEALFLEPSPAPLKAAMRWVGLPAGGLRPPMVEIDADTEQALREAMTASGIAVPSAA